MSEPASLPEGGTDAVVVGGGIVGTAIAWRCAQRGLRVAVVDPQPPPDGAGTSGSGTHPKGFGAESPMTGAWHTAAGMLAPITELHYTETPLLRLNVESLRRYPAFVAELTELTGLATGFAESGTVLAAWDAADLAGLRDLHAFMHRLGLSAELLSGRELRTLEPALAAGLPGALYAAGDHQVDPRLLHRAVAAAARASGAHFVTGTARVVVSGERVQGVEVDSILLPADQVVLAAGCWSAAVDGVPVAAVPPVRPVKGQTLRLRVRDGQVLNHVARARIKGAPIYLVPRADGEVVVGASVEEAGFDRSARAGAVYELLRDAQSLVPELGEAALLEVSTGLRPGSPDNAPLVGRSGIDGLVHATGHYRNGVLLTPVTADGVADLLAGGTLPDVLVPFVPDRFDRPVPASTTPTTTTPATATPAQEPSR